MLFRSYMAFSDGHVVAYDAKTGSEKWAPVDLTGDIDPAGGEAPKYLDADATPVVDPSAAISNDTFGLFALYSSARVGTSFAPNVSDPLMISF